MKRDIEETLRSWKKEEHRYPLLVRGARQVGKSCLIQHVLDALPVGTIQVNLEVNPVLRAQIDKSA